VAAWVALSCQVGEQWSALLSELLQSQGALSVSLVPHSDQHLQNESLSSFFLIEALFAEGADIAEVKANLQWVKQEGLQLEWQVRSIPDRDWVTECQKDYSPVLVDDRLWICSELAEVDSASHHSILRVNPGAAFGTGGHETTLLCLQWLTQAKIAGQVVLDYGCGSGVLALAAVQLGARCCVGVDNDPSAIVASRKNASMNGVSVEKRLSFHLSDDFTGIQANVILANMLAPPLRKLVSTFDDCLLPNGWCVLSGLMEHNLPEIRALYASRFSEQACWAEGEWFCLIYQKIT
jgi:ribosomal protein L11 methyltransferase